MKVAKRALISGYLKFCNLPGEDQGHIMVSQLNANIVHAPSCNMIQHAFYTYSNLHFIYINYSYERQSQKVHHHFFYFIHFLAFQ